MRVQFSFVFLVLVPCHRLYPRNQLHYQLRLELFVAFCAPRGSFFGVELLHGDVPVKQVGIGIPVGDHMLSLKNGQYLGICKPWQIIT